MRRLRLSALAASMLAVMLFVFAFTPVAVAVDPDFMSVKTKLVAADGQDAEYFGNAVAISGDYAVIGMWGDDDAGWNSGAAYVFVRVGSTWVQHQRLTASDGAANAGFGRSVAISGSTIVVGAPGASLPPDLAQAGAAYVFALNGITWSQQAKLTAGAEASAYDAFGTSVGVWRDEIVVGAPNHDRDGFENVGTAHVFRRSGATWSHEVELGEAATEDEEHFGQSVAISGSRIVIGKPNADVRYGDDGAVNFYVRGLMGWVQDGLGWGPSEQDQAGHVGASVAISGDCAIIGAPDTDTTEPGAGVAYIVRRGPDDWIEEQKLEEPEGASQYAHFGFSVAIDGATAVVGAPSKDAGPGNQETGMAFVFTGALNQWNWAKTLWQGAPVPWDRFGYSVAVQGGTAMAGAPASADESDGTGSVYAFQTPVSLTPIYRFYKKGAGTHFYTPSTAERDEVISKYPTVYAFEGVAYSVYPPNNNQPLYRFYNKKNGSHFYTASAAERDMVKATWPTVFTYEGETYKVSTAPAPGKTTVYRFYNKKNGSHFFTASEAEKTEVIAKYSATYAFEGPAFWLGQ